MINDKEFLKFEDGFFKPYFEKFIEFKRGKGEKVASSTLIRFRKLNNSLNQYQTDQISEKMIRELLTPHNGLSEIERQYMAYKELIEKIGLPYICPHDLRHTYTTLLMKNNINQRAIAASLGHTQFETYTDEHRKEYVIADNSLNEDIYERGIETNVGDLMYGATKEAKGLLDLAEAEETFAQAGEKCVQNAIITTVQYIYKFGCEVGIY